MSTQPLQRLHDLPGAIIAVKTAVTCCISLFIFFLVPNGGRAQDSGGRHSFQFDRLPLRAAIDSLMKWFPESIVYLDNEVEGKSVSGSCSHCDFEQALNTLLNGTSLTWVKSGNQVIVRREDRSQPEVSATVSGTVTDSVTGEWIAGASVMLQNTARGTGNAILRWCPTNDFGFFSLPRVPAGTYVLTYRALGYETVSRTATITADRNLECDAGMSQKDITMQEVTVEGRRVAMTSVAGISRGVYLRSVPTDRNQYSLEGGRIYNPTHFGGVLSTFSPEVLNDVQVLEGGLPPSYGGRVGGFVDLSLRDGSRERLSGSAGAGTLGSTLSLGGPVNGSTTFLLSGRRGYPDAAMEFLHTGGNPSRQRFSELVGKVTHRLSGSGQVSLSGYLGGDTYENHVAGSGQQLNNNFSWDNAMLDLRWIGTVSPSLFLYASASYSRYGFDLQHSLSADSALTSVPGLSSDYGIEDFTVRVHAEDYYDEDHTVRAGAEVVHHRMHGTISAFSTQVAPFSLQNFSSWEATVYLQDQWRLLPGLTAELGGRATSFLGDDGTFSGVDPRFSLRASLDQETFMYCSLSGINQFVHPYRNSGIFLLYPTVFWYPSTDTVRPSTSVLLSLGAQRTFDDEQYIASVESYYRITNNLHEFGLDTMARFSPDLDASILFGTGRTYGLVFTFQRRTGDLTGSVTYNLSWSTEQFAGVNAGREFPSPFDRRHEVQVSARYALGGEWTLGAVCALATGQSSLMSPKISTPSGYRNAPFAANAVAPYNEFLDINGGKLPGFQRLEFSAVRRFVAWGLPCQFTFRLLNSYGLLDPFVWNLQRSNDMRTLWNVSLKEPSLVPLYPAIGLNVRF
jgi:hypothetical protein